MAQTAKRKDSIVQSLLISGGFLALLWLIHIIVWFSGIDPGIFGNYPRKISGLVGVLSSPLFHADWIHLISNSIPLFLFSSALLIIYRKASIQAMAAIWVLSGIWVWMVARSVPVIGASGLVYGFGAFLFFSGIFRKDRISIAVAFVIAAFYGGMISGIGPGKPGISWESHLFGLLAGAVAAWYYRKVGIHPKKKYSWEDEPESESGDDQAAWNYRKNWTGSETIIYPSHEDEARNE